MSSFKRRHFLRALVAGGTMLILAGCFRPLHGPSITGEPMAQTLAAVDVPSWKLEGGKEYLGHVIRTELISQLSGFGAYKDVPKRYRLQLGYSEVGATAHIDQVTSRADSTVITGTLSLTLFEGSTVKFNGSVKSMVSFERTSQRFATLRANRDAYARLGKALAEEAKLSLSLFFATGR